MAKNELNNDWLFDGLGREYFEWLVQLVRDPEHKQESFRTLLRHLHMCVFAPSLPMDANRAEDGINLRYRFGYEREYSDPLIASYLDFFPCSMLEMMVGLSFRCEEEIMGDPLDAFRAGKWFWEMIESLGLADQDNENFDESYTHAVVDRFLRHEYARDGRGGLFTIPAMGYDSLYDADMRNIEIWRQLCRYLVRRGE